MVLQLIESALVVIYQIIFIITIIIITVIFIMNIFVLTARCISLLAWFGSSPISVNVMIL